MDGDSFYNPVIQSEYCIILPNMLTFFPVIANHRPDFPLTKLPHQSYIRNYLRNINPQHSSARFIEPALGFNQARHKLHL